MKKLYSLVAIALFSVAAVAQTTLLSEDFASITTGDNTTTSGSGTIWAGNANFPDAGNVRAYQAGGAVKLGTASLVGSITTKPLDLSTDAGNFTVTFDVKGWTTVEGDIIVTVSGMTPTTVPYTATRTDAFQNITLTFGGGTAGSTITIATSAKRAFIDNVAVTTVPIVLGVNDLTTIQNNFVKNTFVENEINFGSKSDVKIYKMNGQIVKSAKVSENKNMNVSDLASGIYIVTGIINGKAVSTKIMKK